MRLLCGHTPQQAHERPQSSFPHSLFGALEWGSQVSMEDIHNLEALNLHVASALYATILLETAAGQNHGYCGSTEMYGDTQNYNRHTSTSLGRGIPSTSLAFAHVAGFLADVWACYCGVP